MAVKGSNVRLTMVLIFPGFKMSVVFHGFSRISADFRRRLRSCADVSWMFRGFSQIFADFNN